MKKLLDIIISRHVYHTEQISYIKRQRSKVLTEQFKLWKMPLSSELTAKDKEVFNSMHRRKVDELQKHLYIFEHRLNELNVILELNCDDTIDGKCDILPKKTSIETWLNNNEVPTKIHSVLTGRNGEYKTKFKYIEDITKGQWCNHRLGTEANWKIFIELKNNSK